MSLIWINDSRGLAPSSDNRSGELLRLCGIGTVILRAIENEGSRLDA
jgi:hypothetical protein